MKGFKLLLLLFLIFSIRCTYSPSGENYLELETENIPFPSINLSDIDSDTISASPGINLEFDFINEYRKVYSVDVYFNGILERKFTYGKSDFNISTRNLPTGYYPLRLVITVSSGTNSLLDQAGGEIEVISKTWTLAVDNDPATPVDLVNIEYDDNSRALVVNWEKYERTNFGRYLIEGRENFTCACKNYFQHIVDDQETTSLKLPDYVGTEMEIRVTVIASTSTDHVPGNSLKVENTTSKFISSKLINNRDLEIKWTKSKYDYSFGSYELYISSGYKYNEYAKISDISDTSYTFKDIPQGAESGFSFKILSKKDKLLHSKTLWVPVNDRKLNFPRNGTIYSIRYAGGYYFLYARDDDARNNFLEVYSEAEDSVVNRFGPGSLVFTKDYAVIYNQPTPIFYTRHFQNIESSNFVNDDNKFIQRISLVSGNNIKVIRYIGDQSTETKFFNLDTEEYIEEEDIELPKYQYRSDNRIWNTRNNESVYNNGAHTYNYLTISKDTNWVSLVSVDPAGGQEDNLDTKTYFKLFSTQDFNLILEKKFDGEHKLLHVNEDFSKFLFYYSHNLKVLDRTGSTLQEIPIIPSTYSYANGNLVSGNGYIVEVDI